MERSRFRVIITISIYPFSFSREIVLVCRICSKSMFAKIMKKHSPHCKKVAEEERILKEFSKKINNITHQVTKEKHVINVDLMIEK